MRINNVIYAIFFSSKRSFVFAWPTLFHDSSLSKENKPPLKIKILFDKTPKLRRQCRKAIGIR